jgi:Ala-tRNA(Pro) deacylase
MAKDTVTSVLEAAGIEYELLPHAHTETALAEAAALGVDPSDVGKTLVVTTPGGYVRALVCAADRLSIRKVRELVGGGKRTHLATEEDLARDYGEFELGAVPPFGGRRDQVLVDRRVAERDSVVVEAGTHDESIRMRAADLVRLTDAQLADLAED